MGASLAGIVDEFKHRRGLSETAVAGRLGMSRMNLNLWRREGLRALPTRDQLETVAEVTDTPYRVVLETALAECGYLDTPPPGDTVSLDGVVAVSRILAGVVGRGLSPSESSRLRAAWVSASPRTLVSVATLLQEQCADG
jgi:transcriptional regulator with XRE-family HTH domain